MKNNQVVLNLEEYNRLRDFETEIKKGNTVINWDRDWDHHHQSGASSFVSTDEAVKKIALQNEIAEKEINELRNKIWNLEHLAEKKYTMANIKHISVREFRKWKKQ